MATLNDLIKMKANIDRLRSNAMHLRQQLVRLRSCDMAQHLKSLPFNMRVEFPLYENLAPRLMAALEKVGPIAIESVAADLEREARAADIAAAALEQSLLSFVDPEPPKEPT